MRIELTTMGRGSNQRVFATPVTAGRPRKTDEIVKSRKVFFVGRTKAEAVAGLLERVGFKPHNAS